MGHHRRNGQLLSLLPTPTTGLPWSLQVSLALAKQRCSVSFWFWSLQGNSVSVTEHKLNFSPSLPLLWSLGYQQHALLLWLRIRPCLASLSDHREKKVTVFPGLVCSKCLKECCSFISPISHRCIETASGIYQLCINRATQFLPINTWQQAKEWRHFIVTPSSWQLNQMHFIFQVGGLQQTIPFWLCQGWQHKADMSMSSPCTYPAAGAQIIQSLVMGRTPDHLMCLWYFRGSPEESKETYGICSWCWPNYHWFQRENEALILTVDEVSSL